MPVCCHCSVIWLLGTLWTGAHRVPQSMGFSRNECCSELPCSHPGDLPNPGMQPTFLLSPALAGGFFITSATWEAYWSRVNYSVVFHSLQPMDCCPPGSSVHRILQARVLEWVAIPFSRGSSWLRDQTQVCHLAGRLFKVWVTSACVLSFFSPVRLFESLEKLAVWKNANYNIHPHF